MRSFITKQRWIILTGFILLSFIFRLSAATNMVVYPDSTLYLSFAKAMLNGKFSFNFSGGDETILPPLYPILDALFAFFNGKIETSAVLVSALAGALLITPVFYIAKTVYNEKAAWISAVFVFLSPILIHWSGAMVTESLFITLFISGIAVCLYGIERRKWIIFLISGALIGMSYMTRVIGFVAVPILGLWLVFAFLVIDRPNDKKPGINFKEAFVPVLTFAFGFMLVTGFYLVKLHSFYGYWTLAGAYGSIKGTISYEGSATKAGWEGARKQTVEESALSKLVKKVSINLVNYSLALLFMLTIGSIFVIAGILFRWKILYLVSVIVIYFAALLVQPMSPMLDERVRYLSPVFPIFLIIASGGILRIGDFVKSTGARKKIISVMFIIVLLSYTLYLKRFPVKFHSWGDHFVSVNENVGLWMKEKLPQPLRIMSRKPFIPFYADGVWFITPPTFPEVIQLAKEKSVDYIVLDMDIDFVKRPALRFLFYQKQVPAELSFIGGIRHPKTGEFIIIIYKINRDKI